VRERVEDGIQPEQALTPPQSSKSTGSGNRRTASKPNERPRQEQPGTHEDPPLEAPYPQQPERSLEPDVLLDISKLKVDEVYLDVEHLEAHLALQARLANLLQLVAGAHVHIGKVEVDIKGVEAEARLEVKLENLRDILDRALTTLDRHPEILEGVVGTIDDALANIGQIGEQALAPGGAVSQAIDDVGQVAQQAVEPGGAVSTAADAAGRSAAADRQTVRDAVHQVLQAARRAVNGSGQNRGGAADRLAAALDRLIGSVSRPGGPSQDSEDAAKTAPAKGGQAIRGRSRMVRRTKRGSKRGSAGPRAGGSGGSSDEGSNPDASSRSSSGARSSGGKAASKPDRPPAGKRAGGQAKQARNTPS
jgi:hypothetical protein